MKADFFDFLFPAGLPDGALFSVSQIKGKQVFTEYVRDGSSLPKQKPGFNYYFCSGLVTKILLSYKRPGLKDVEYIFGTCADIDCQAPHHKKEGLAPNKRAALEALVQATPLLPTLVIDTGGGLQAHWIFKESLEVDQRADPKQSQAYRLRHGWLKMLQGNMPFTLDAVHNTDRLMRMPGTTSFSNPEKPFEVVPVDGNLNPIEDLLKISPKYYDYTDFLPYLTSVSPAAPADTPPQTSLDIAVGRGRPFPANLVLLLDEDDAFADVWFHRRSDFNEDQSSYDMSIAAMLMAAEWDEQTIVDALIHNRLTYDKQHADKVEREDYYKRTLQKASEGLTAAQQIQSGSEQPAPEVNSQGQSEQPTEQNDSPATPLSLVTDDGPPLSDTLSRFDAAAIVDGRADGDAVVDPAQENKKLEIRRQNAKKLWSIAGLPVERIEQVGQWEERYNVCLTTGDKFPVKDTGSLLRYLTWEEIYCKWQHPFKPQWGLRKDTFTINKLEMIEPLKVYCVTPDVRDDTSVIEGLESYFGTGETLFAGKDLGADEIVEMLVATAGQEIYRSGQPIAAWLPAMRGGPVFAWRINGFKKYLDMVYGVRVTIKAIKEAYGTYGISHGQVRFMDSKSRFTLSYVKGNAAMTYYMLTDVEGDHVTRYKEFLKYWER